MQVPFSMPIGNAELRYESSPKHLCMGTARSKYDKETVRMQADGVEMEISKAGTKEKKSRQFNCLSGLPYLL